MIGPSAQHQIQFPITQGSSRNGRIWRETPAGSAAARHPTAPQILRWRHMALDPAMAGLGLQKDMTCSTLTCLASRQL